MSFNAALSGLRSASTDLKVTGNNIANASTTGFKSSRVEFGDVYASSVLGSGLAQTGGGSRVQDIAQQFSQGNISFTSSQLDLAISGQGFFVVEQNDSRLYSRAGTFSLDDKGFVVNNSGGRLQGFDSDRFGNFSGVLSDVQIETGNQPPRQTTGVTSSLNLDAAEPVLQRNGVTFESTGAVIGLAQIGDNMSTQTSLKGMLAPTNFDFSGTGNNVSFDISLNNSTNQTIILQDDLGDLNGLVEEINRQIFEANTPLDMYAEVSGSSIKFVAFAPGSDQIITVEPTVAGGVTDYSGLQAIGFGDFTAGVWGDSVNPYTGLDEVTNGYKSQSFVVTYPNGSTVNYASTDDATAAVTASEINNLAGLSASALTKASIDVTSAAITSGFVLNDVALSGTVQEVIDQINTLSNSYLPGISAELDTTGANIILTSIVGDDIKLSLPVGSTDDLIVTGQNGTSQTLNVDDKGIVVGGVIDVVLDEGYSISDLDPPVNSMFTSLAINTADSYTINAFDPTNPATYNHATSVSVYDSLGEAHVMTQYFVKQEFDPTDPAKNEPNVWKMYVQIDGQDVGDPDTSLAPPLNTLPTLATYTLRFNPDGSLNTATSSQLLVSNWTPSDAEGKPIGALGPINKLEGATFPVEEPAVSSNFALEMSSTTQFSSTFAVNSVDQNGYSTGLLTGLTIDSEGIIFARYTNGESVALSQLALANFDNVQGFAGSGSLGVIQAGALEESNVDLSEQLVNLIIAQRNFQANAKTIETANQITQTIINLR
jgi:flagellar hook protein FlgE